MKKLIAASLCLFALASCDVKQSKEYKELKAQQDSILLVNAEAKLEMEDMMEIINEVEENFSKIKETEKYLTVESQTEGQLSTGRKDKIAQDFAMMQEIMQKNKAELERLNKRLKNSSGEVAGLKKTIERLNNELAERAQKIIDLQAALEKKDARISELETNLQSLQGDVQNLATQTSEQASMLKAQESKLNTAYYMFGTSRELKEAKVISGGFLRSTKILTDGIEKSKFIEIDIRHTQAIPVFSKKAKLLSDHPEDSYAFEKDDNDNVIVKILDYSRFWSLTKFLIVEIG